MGTYRPSRAASAVALAVDDDLARTADVDDAELAPREERALVERRHFVEARWSSITGITPPTIMRSMWLNVRLTSSGREHAGDVVTARAASRCPRSG